MKYDTTLIKPSQKGWQVIAVTAQRSTRTERVLADYDDRAAAEEFAATTGNPITVIERACSFRFCPACGQGVSA